MSFWDRPVRDSFDEMFDIDRNGRLDAVEEAIQWDYLDQETREMEEAESNDRELDDLEDELEDEVFSSSGMTWSELETMDEEERREILADAGLDPDDFDF